MPTYIDTLYVLNLRHELNNLESSPQILSLPATGSAANSVTDRIRFLNSKNRINGHTGTCRNIFDHLSKSPRPLVSKSYILFLRRYLHLFVPCGVKEQCTVLRPYSRIFIPRWTIVILQRTDDPPEQSQILSTTHTVSDEINRRMKMCILKSTETFAMQLMLCEYVSARVSARLRIPLSP